MTDKHFEVTIECPSENLTCIIETTARDRYDAMDSAFQIFEMQQQCDNSGLKLKKWPKLTATVKEVER